MFVFVLLLLGLFLLATWIASRRMAAGRPPGFFFEFWPSLGRSLAAWPLAWALPVAVTLLFALTPLDLAAKRLVHAVNPLGWDVAWGMLVYGNFAHLLIGLGAWAWGKARADRELVLGACAAVQALFVNVLVVNTLKLLTGRTGPLHVNRPGHLSSRVHFRRSDDPLDFAFDFWNHAFVHGRFFWPSGHTASAFAFAAALCAFWPEKRWLVWVGYGVAALMGLSMVNGDFHWTSDVLAGAPLGWVIGHTVGTAFRKRALPASG